MSLKRPREVTSFDISLESDMDPQRLENLIIPAVEPLIRRIYFKSHNDNNSNLKDVSIIICRTSRSIVVKEEVDSALRQHMINRERNNMLSFESRNLRLQFSNSISHLVYAKNSIKAEGGTAIEVTLVDASNGQVVSSGPGSFAKVGIMVVRGDFGNDGIENWTLEEFTRNIVKERESKKPLLIGDVILTLKDGKGLVGDVSFTDNSSWTRSGKFRLGAKLIDNIDGVRVREARSEPFIVKSPIRDSQKKHHPPSPSDEVWRLDNISKDGRFHKRLSEGGVNTVQDFLTLFFSEPKRLQDILKNMSTKAREVTVQHARTCILGRTLYIYHGSTSPQTNGVVFNVVRQVMGMFKDSQYVSTDKLSEAEKKHARALVISALENRDKIVTLVNESSLNVPPSLPSSNTNHQDQRSHNIGSFPYTQQHDTSSLEVMQSYWPITGGSPSFEGFSHNLDLMGKGCDQPMSFPNTQQHNASSSDFMSSLWSIGGSSNFDRFSQSRPNEHRAGYDQPLSFPNQTS